MAPAERPGSTPADDGAARVGAADALAPAGSPGPTPADPALPAAAGADATHTANLEVAKPEVPAHPPARPTRVGYVRFVLGLFGRHAILLLISMAAQVTNIVVQLKRPLVDGQVSSALGDADDFRRALWRLVVLMVLEKGLVFVQDYARDTALDGFERKLELELLTSLLRQDTEYFDSHPPAELAGRVHGTANHVRNFMGMLLSGTVGSFLNISGGLHELYHYSPSLMAKLLAFLVPGAAYFAAILSAHMRAKHESGEKWGRRHGRLVETITNIRTVQACSAEELELWKYHQRTREAIDAGVWDRRTGFLLGNSIGCVNSGIHVFLLHMGSKFVCEGSMSGPEVGAMFHQTFRVLGSAGHLIGMMQELTRGFNAVQAVVEALGRVPKVPCDVGLMLTPDVARGSISFENVHFRYPARPGDEVLSGVTTRVSAGGVTALVGLSGSGKSTLGWLLQRAYDPADGRIEIGGTDLRTVAPRSLRRHIAHVEQEPRLFSGSIRENIRYGRHGASDTEVEAAAAVAGVSGFAAQLPRGLETEVGGFGSSLSGGQKQRVAIARALLKRPRILIMDEATSALDVETERQLMRGLSEHLAGCTVLLIAHRLSTVRNAGHIVVMQQGRVVEAGSYEELMRRADGAFKRLAQQGGGGAA